MGRFAVGLWTTAAAAVVALDQWSKSWALAELRGHPPLSLIPGFFDLCLSRNTGGVFGLLAGPPSLGRRLFFTAVTLAALALIGILLRGWARQSRILSLALALIAGGAVGNLIDRLRFGSVVDFIDWYWRGHHWPTFNIADSAITAGAALIILHGLGAGRRAGAADGATRG